MRAKFDFERTFHADVYFIRDSKARLARSKRALDVFAMSPDQRDSSSSLACSLLGGWVFGASPGGVFEFETDLVICKETYVIQKRMACTDRYAWRVLLILVNAF